MDSARTWSRSAVWTADVRRQAVEKLLKAILTERGVTFRTVHDLVYLLDRVVASGLEISDDVAAAAWLQASAVTARDFCRSTTRPSNGPPPSLVVRVRGWSEDVRA